MNETLCPFPLTADRACGRTVAQRSGPGRPRVYCSDPKHTAVARLRADRRFQARTAHGTDTGPERPVTERVSALAAALDRLGDLKAGLLAELADAEELAAGAGPLRPSAGSERHSGPELRRRGLRFGAGPGIYFPLRRASTAHDRARHQARPIPKQDSTEPLSALS